MAEATNDLKGVMKNPIFVALDVDSATTAYEIAEAVKDYVGGYKVGPRLVLRHGAELISRLAKMKPVFVDNKYYDIPNTMEAAVRATFEAGATFATIHAGAGPDALKRLATVERELSARRPFRLLAVTVLTSFSGSNRPPHWNPTPLAAQVQALAQSAMEAGLRGLVCSAKEVGMLRDRYADAFLLTPGIRLPEDASADQARVTSPYEAITKGASAIVVGRPIVEASDPMEAAKRYFRALNV